MLKSRRTGLLPILSSVVLIATLAACGGDDSAGDTTGAPDTTPSAPSTTGDSAAAPEGAPIEVVHALGTTTVPAGVERVVALGPADLDAALALGAPVVGAASSGSESGVPAWAADAPGVDGIEILPVEGDALTVDLEHVAALHPDLILAATYYEIDDAYELLSQIAPTIAYQDGPVTDTWQQVTRQVGAALGRDAEAEALVAGVEGQIDAAAAAHPELDGATFTFAYAYTGGLSVLRDPSDVMFTVPAGLGMSLTPEILAMPQGESFAIDLSLEQIESIDADVLAIFDAGDTEVRSALESNPLYQGLDAVARDAVVSLDYDQFVGLRQPSALSIPWVLEGIVAQFAAAVAA